MSFIELCAEHFYASVVHEFSSCCTKESSKEQE
jgi:hypothetical protein